VTYCSGPVVEQRRVRCRDQQRWTYVEESCWEWQSPPSQVALLNSRNHHHNTIQYWSYLAYASYKNCPLAYYRVQCTALNHWNVQTQMQQPQKFGAVFLLVLLPVIITVHLKANLKLTCLPPSWPPSASVSFYQRIWRYINFIGIFVVLVSFFLDPSTHSWGMENWGKIQLSEIMQRNYWALKEGVN